MSLVKNVELENQLQDELAAAGERLVIVYYSATWCAPCKRIKPVVEALSRKYTQAVFLKVDVDLCQETAMAQEVTAMPTFAFHKNKEKLDMLEGADPNALENKIIQIGKFQTQTNATSEVDLFPYILMSKSECVNEAGNIDIQKVFALDDSYVESKSNAQLIISVTFREPVKINWLKIKAPKTNGPKEIKLFVNEPRTLTLQEGLSKPAIQELTLTLNELSGSSTPIQYTRFQKVTNIQLFVKNSQDKSNTTIINYLAFMGSAAASANVGDFKHSTGNKGALT